MRGDPSAVVAIQGGAPRAAGRFGARAAFPAPSASPHGVSVLGPRGSAGTAVPFRAAPAEVVGFGLAGLALRL